MSPGVSLADVPATPAAGLLTGVPVFLGAVADPAALGSGAALLTAASWGGLEQRRGAAWASGHLGFAVRGFFQNGGRRAYVVDLPDPSGLDEALARVAEIDDFDLVCAPGIAALDAAPLAAAQVRILELCAARGDCFAILDAVGCLSADLAVAKAVEHRSELDGAIAAAVARGSLEEALRMNGALYFPWIEVRGAGGDGFVPPSGHVAGVYARTDASAGAHKAPANEVVNGALDLRAGLTAAQQAALNPSDASSINCLRAFAGRGIRIWGARTLSRDPAWIHVGSRRLVSTIRRWLDLSMAGFAFEVSEPGLWIRINREVSAFLEDLHRAGALHGATPSEAFYVKCDAETNPPEVRDAGQVVTEIGVATASPSEFFVVRLIHDADGVAVASAP